MGMPFMLEQTLVGINIAEGRRVAGAGCVGAILGIASAGVLGP